MTRLSLVAILFVLSSLASADDEKVEAALKELTAAVQGQDLLVACGDYATKPANTGNNYPTALAQLVTPPFGGASFLKNGKADLLDPWGKMFQYAVVKDEKGNERVYVWTERTVDGKTKVIGTKPPEPEKK